MNIERRENNGFRSAPPILRFETLDVKNDGSEESITPAEALRHRESRRQDTFSTAPHRHSEGGSENIIPEPGPFHGCIQGIRVQEKIEGRESNQQNGGQNEQSEPTAFRAAGLKMPYSSGRSNMGSTLSKKPAEIFFHRESEPVAGSHSEKSRIEIH